MLEKRQISAMGAIRPDSIQVNGKDLKVKQRNEGFSSFAKSLYKELDLQYAKFFKMDNLCKLGLLTTEMVVREIQDMDKIAKDKIGVFLMNRRSSLDTDQRFFQTVASSDHFAPSPSLFVYTLPNILIGEISIKYQLTGEQAFFISEQLDESYLFHYTDYLLAQKKLHCALIGWVDFYQEEYSALMMWVESVHLGKNRPLSLEYTPDALHQLTKNNLAK